MALLLIWGTTMNTTGNICTPFNTFRIPDAQIADTYLHHEYWLTLYLIPVIIVVGAVGNIAFLFMLVRLPYMRTTVNAYLANLAVVDLVYLLTVAPIYPVHTYVKSPINMNVPFTGEYSCILFFAHAFLCYYSSVNLITVISFERYNAICHPLYHRKIHGKKRTFIVLCVSWIVAIVLSVFTTTRRGTLLIYCFIWPEDDKYETLPTIFRTCGPLGDREIYISSMTILYIAYFFVALVINGYFYIHIMFVLSRRLDLMEGAEGGSQQQEQVVQVRNQVAKALVILGLVYFVTQTPIRIEDINEVFREFTSSGFLNQNQISIFNSVGLTFLFINSAVNSYIYVFSSSFYRQGFLEAFWLSQRKNNLPSQYMSRNTMTMANRTNGTQYAHVSAKSWVWFLKNEEVINYK